MALLISLQTKDGTIKYSEIEGLNGPFFSPYSRIACNHPCNKIPHESPHRRQERQRKTFERTRWKGKLAAWQED